MLKIKTKVTNLEALKNQIVIVKNLTSMVKDVKLQLYIQKKCLETVKKVTEERLVGGTTNDDMIEIYKANHKIASMPNGFILYNDTKIPADQYNILPFDTSGYPEGMFNVALAFEYGTGVLGIGVTTNDFVNSRSNSHKRLQDAWYLPVNAAGGENGVLTQGYAGFEIYRFTAERIRENINKWIIEYQERKSGAST